MHRLNAERGGEEEERKKDRGRLAEKWGRVRERGEDGEEDGGTRLQFLPHHI